MFFVLSVCADWLVGWLCLCIGIAAGDVHLLAVMVVAEYESIIIVRGNTHWPANAPTDWALLLTSCEQAERLLLLLLLLQ